MVAQAAIPAWAIWTMIGAQVGSGILGNKAQAKDKEKDRELQNKQFIEQMAMKNRELKQQDDQFRQMQKLKEKENVESGPSKIMNTMSMISQLGKQPASTADTLKYLTS